MTYFQLVVVVVVFRLRGRLRRRPRKRSVERRKSERGMTRDPLRAIGWERVVSGANRRAVWGGLDGLD